MLAQVIKRHIRKAIDPWTRHDDLLAFVHIPKTAGTSLVSAFKREFRRSRSLRLDEAKDLQRLERIELRRKYDFLHGHFGMMDVENIASEHVTVLRDPTARILSLYNFWRAKAEDRDEKTGRGDLPEAMRLTKTLSFRDFVFSDVPRIVNDIQNAQSYQIAASNKVAGRQLLADASDDDLFRLACENVDRMAVAGCVEGLSHFERNVSAKLGLDISVPVKNRTKRQALMGDGLPEDVLDRLQSINRVDIKLHAYVRSK